MPVRQRLELFVSICHAVQHAHQKGIIHRDLKPSNIMVTIHDDLPVAKVIDFGVAKATGQQLTEKALFTNFAQMIGTPLYMSPEQALMSGLDVDTRTDIYSLGVLLYELLTGTTPFARERLKTVAYDELRRIIREEDPPKPSTRISSLGQAATAISIKRKSAPNQLRRLFRGELDWIVMKALEKDRNRRYETASALAADVQHYLKDEAVAACPPSSVYRLRKFARRNRGSLLAAALVFLALVGGIIGTTVGMLRAQRAKEAEAEQRRIAQDNEKSAKEREAETRAVLDFVENKVLAAARPKDLAGGQRYDVKLADAVKAALPFVDKSFTAQPLIEARLHRTMGLSFWYLGDINTAIEQFQAAREIYTEHLGPDHPETLKCMNGLASSYYEAGRLQEALKLFEEAVQRKRAKLGPDHPETLKSMNNLAASYLAAGRIQEAIKLHEETLQFKKAKLGPEHPDTLRSMMTLANSYADGGHTLEALKLREEAFRLHKATLGPDHPETLWSMHNLANSYGDVGRIQEALKLHEETLRLRKANLGPDHRDTLASMAGLANSYVEVGRIQEGIKLHEETLQLKKAKLGPEHPDTLDSMAGLANSYVEVGRIQEGIKLHEETLQLKKAKLGPEHPDTLQSMTYLAVSYHAAGRTRAALKLHEETLQLMKAKLGPEHPDTLKSMMGLANSYADAGRTREALKLHEETLQLKKAKLGPGHPDTIRSMNWLASSYVGVGEAAKAVSILQDTLALRERRVKADPGNTLDQSMLAWTHEQLGEADQARLDYGAAAQAFSKSVEMFDKLDRAGALMDPLFRGRWNVSRQRLALCRKAGRAVKDLDFALQRPAAEVPGLLDLRVRSLLKEQKLPAALESAAKMRELASNQADLLYGAAAAYALCAGAVKQAKTPVVGATSYQDLTDHALALLKEAIAKGYKDAAHMRQDKDFDTLRDRADFQKLLVELEAGKKS
jgi:tetratricopeptide (TPR) repeat protein